MYSTIVQQLYLDSDLPTRVKLGWNFLCAFGRALELFYLHSFEKEVLLSPPRRATLQKLLRNHAVSAAARTAVLPAAPSVRSSQHARIFATLHF